MPSTSPSTRACSAGSRARIGEELLVTPKTRVIIEKPIGHDLETACEVNDAVGQVFDESQIYRIDHYLGKETVQNLMALRFANALFEPLWNAEHIDHVQITVAETLGVEGRGAYYDHSGALRDIVQNHIIQLLCLVAMEPPARMDADSVRDEKLKVIRALLPINEKNAGTADRARPVSLRQYRRLLGALLSQRGRQHRQHHRDLRHHQGRDRQLALGRCPVLSPDRQAPGGARLGDRRRFQARSRIRSSKPAPATSTPTSSSSASSPTRA